MKNSELFPIPRERLTEVETATKVSYSTDLIEIEGLISQSGQSGSPGSPNKRDFDVQLFSFDAWRKPGQPVVKNKLVLLRAMPLGAKFSKELSKLTIHRFVVLLSDDETRALIWRRSEQPPDTSDLTEIAGELTKPVIIDTEKLGKLTLDRGLNWMAGEIELNGKPAQITIERDQNDCIESGLSVANTLVENQFDWSWKAKEIVIKELLPIYNESWRVDDGPDMTAEKFLSRIKLETISIEVNDRFRFYYNDDDLFCGHIIELTGTLEEGFTEAGIAG